MSIYLHPFEAVLWAISILGTYALAWIVCFRPGQRHYPFFAYFVTFSAFGSTSLFVASACNDGVVYTFIYGVVNPSENALACLAIGQSVWRVAAKRIGIVGGAWKLTLDFTPYVVTAITILYFFRPTTLDLWISFDWALILLCAGFLWVISFATDSWKLQWRTREYGIAAGFLWLCSLRFVIVGLRVVTPPQLTPSLYAADLCIGIVAILIWTRFFLKKEPKLQVLSLEQVAEVNAVFHNFKKCPKKESVLTASERRA